MACNVASAISKARGLLGHAVVTQQELINHRLWELGGVAESPKLVVESRSQCLVGSVHRLINKRVQRSGQACRLPQNGP